MCKLHFGVGYHCLLVLPALRKTSGPGAQIAVHSSLESRKVEPQVLSGSSTHTLAADQGSRASARSSCGCFPQIPRCSHWGAFLTLPPLQHPALPPGWWSGRLGRRIRSSHCCLPSSRWCRTGMAPCSPAACSASWGSGQISAPIWLVEASQLPPILSPHLCRAEANWTSSLVFWISCSQALSLSGRSRRKTWRSECKSTHCRCSSPCCGIQHQAWLGSCLHGPSSAWEVFYYS